jgi:hypothetical protein
MIDKDSPRVSSMRNSSCYFSRVCLLLFCGAAALVVTTFDVSEIISLDSVSKNGGLEFRTRRIQQISVLGERNSGTRWTYGCV